MSAFLEFVDRAVIVEDELRHDADIRVKLDILDRLIQIARFELAYDANRVDMRELLRERAWLMDPSGTLTVHAKHGYQPSVELPEYRRANDLEGALLVFLLIHHRESDPVLKTIERFVAEIRAALNPLDFERTRTSVIRCYTASRFAATRLRGYGLLRYGRDEEFKRWGLTFLGLTVAASIYREGWQDASRGTAEELTRGAALANQIWKVLSKLERPESWGEVLDHLCHESGMPFPPYDGSSLEAAAQLMTRFNEVARSTRGARKARDECCWLAQEVDRLPWVEQFMDALRVGYQMKDSLAGALRREGSR